MTNPIASLPPDNSRTSDSMTLKIDGRSVRVSRNFLDLSREQQDATVDEIAAHMRSGSASASQPGSPMEAELFDGTILEFPQGTSPDVIKRVAKEQTAIRHQHSGGGNSPLASIRAKYPGAYDDMSDDQLADALYRKHYSDMPRADFDAKIGLVSPTAAQRELARRELERRRTGTGVGAGSLSSPDTSTGYDVARSFGTGVRQGVEGLVGLPGDVRDMMGSGASWLAGKFGASEQNQDRFRRGAELIAPFGAGINQAATTQDVQGVTSAAVGKHYEPQTTAGEYARTTGQFATGAAAGPGGLARKTAMAVVPAAASETAGQLTKGTSAEPYARLGGALVGGGLAAGRSPNAVKELAKAAPTREALKAQTDELYGLMRESGIRYDPDQYGQMVLKAAADIRKQGFRPSTADQAFKLMDDLATDIGKAPDFDDINGLVQQTGAAARAAAAKGDGTTAKALGIIRDHLDDFEASAMMTSDQPLPKDIFNGLRKSARETALRNIKARTLDEIFAKATPMQRDKRRASETVSTICFAQSAVSRCSGGMSGKLCLRLRKAGRHCGRSPASDWTWSACLAMHRSCQRWAQVLRMERVAASLLPFWPLGALLRRLHRRA
jgi:hypothetical protein